MAKQTINKLKSWFITLAKPTQQQFWDWMDSFWHKEESIPISSINGLTDIVNNTASATVLNSVSEELNTHLADKNNPHKVTKAQLGLENVDNTSDVEKPLSNAASQAITNIGDIVDEHVGNTENPHNVTASQLGLGKVNNTSDAEKPVSTATQAALNTKLSQSGDAFGNTIEIGSKDNNDVVIKTNNTEQLRVDRNGVVTTNKLIKLGTSYNYYGVLSVEDLNSFYKSRLVLRPAGNSAGFSSAYWGCLENSGYTFSLLSGLYQDLVLGIDKVEIIRISNSSKVVTINSVINNTTLKGVGNRMLLADSSGNITNLAAVISGEKVITQTASGIQNSAEIVEQIASVSQLNLLASATWNSGTASVTGRQGQYGFDSNYRYDCVADNTWKRTCLNETKVDLFLSDIDDTAADKTSIDLNTQYPGAVIGQWIWGANNLYIKKTTTLWIKTKVQAA